MEGDIWSWLRCPRDGAELRRMGESRLACPHGHGYPVVDGIPVLLRDDVPQTFGPATDSLAAHAHGGGEASGLHVATLGVTDAQRKQILALHAAGPQPVDPVVSVIVGATNGYAYRDAIGRLDHYPVPELRVPDGTGRTFLDVGCSWGRWCIAAVRKGYRAVGIDPSLGAVAAARRVARSLGLPADYVCADARYLPFPGRKFDTVFSYSVLQHFAKPDALAAIAEIARVTASDGRSLVQMAHSVGLRSGYHQARRGFRAARGFEVRYWSVPELRRAFARHFADVRWSAHCYFGLGLESADRDVVSPLARMLICASDGLRSASDALPGLRYLADSIYVSAERPTP